MTLSASVLLLLSLIVPAAAFSVPQQQRCCFAGVQFSQQPKRTALELITKAKSATTISETTTTAQTQQPKQNKTQQQQDDDDEAVSSLLLASAATANSIVDAATTDRSPATSVAETSSTGTNNGDNGNLLWRGVVVALCAVWASNFAVGKLVMAEPSVDSSLYALARFGVAALALGIPALVKQFSTGSSDNNKNKNIISIDDDNNNNKGDKLDWKAALTAATCGGWVAFGYLGQTIGLLTTTASRSCVICTLHCVFVAIIAEVLRVQRSNSNSSGMSRLLLDNEEEEKEAAGAKFDFRRLIPASVAVLGVALIELQGAGGAPTIGDILSFAQPIGFGMGYLQLEDIMRQQPQAALSVSAIKLAIVAAASFVFYQVSPMLLHGGGGVGGGAAVAGAFSLAGWPDFTPILQSPIAVGGILYTGLITTALALWVESIAFKRVPATDASLILTTEPLFAAAAGAVALGETFGISDYVGAALIVGACAVSVLMDDESQDDECPIEDAMQGKCEPRRALPISPE